MTQEIPQQKSRCGQCGEQVTLERTGNYGTLQVSCACDSRAVKVSEATPKEWQL